MKPHLKSVFESFYMKACPRELGASVSTESSYRCCRSLLGLFKCVWPCWWRCTTSCCSWLSRGKNSQKFSRNMAVVCGRCWVCLETSGLLFFKKSASQNWKTRRRWKLLLIVEACSQDSSEWYFPWTKLRRTWCRLLTSVFNSIGVIKSWLIILQIAWKAYHRFT